MICVVTLSVLCFLNVSCAVIQVITVKYASIFIITNQAVCVTFLHADLIDPRVGPATDDPAVEFAIFLFWEILLASVVKMTTPRNSFGRREEKRESAHCLWRWGSIVCDTLSLSSLFAFAQKRER